MIQDVNDFPFEQPRELPDDRFCAVVDDLAVPQAALGRTALMLVKVGAVLEDIGDLVLAESGLDSREYMVLAILSVDGPGSQHEIARLIGKAPGIVVALVDQLERTGLVERNRDPEDRRRSRVTLTGAGRAALARADELADASVGQILGGLDTAALAQLRTLLERGLGLTAATAGTGV